MIYRFYLIYKYFIQKIQLIFRYCLIIQQNSKIKKIGARRHVQGVDHSSHTYVRISPHYVHIFRITSHFVTFLHIAPHFYAFRHIMSNHAALLVILCIILMKSGEESLYFGSFSFLYHRLPLYLL